MVATETAKVSATSAWLAPASMARSTRCRKSWEEAFIRLEITTYLAGKFSDFHLFTVEDTTNIVTDALKRISACYKYVL